MKGMELSRSLCDIEQKLHHLNILANLVDVPQGQMSTSAEESEEIIIETLANDTPSQVQVKSITPNSVKMAWNKPTFVAPGVSIDIYEYKIGKGIIIFTCLHK